MVVALVVLLVLGLREEELPVQEQVVVAEQMVAAAMEGMLFLMCLPGMEAIIMVVQVVV